MIDTLLETWIGFKAFLVLIVGWGFGYGLGAVLVLLLLIKERIRDYFDPEEWD